MQREIHYVIKFVSTQQLLKSPHLLMESGDVVLLDQCVIFCPLLCQQQQQQQQ